MSNIYYGQYEWINKDGMEFWRPPGGDALTTIDLRSLTQMSRKGPIPEGIGIFIYQGIRNYPELTLNLGNDIERNISSVERTGIEMALGLRSKATRENTVWQVILELLLSDDDGRGKPLWDATGQNSYKPMRGSMRKGVGLKLAEWSSLFDAPFTQSHPAWATTVAVFQADYRRNRSHVDLGFMPLEALQRFTGATMLKLTGRMNDNLASEILPPEYRADGWRLPTTDLGDTFVAGADTDLRFHIATGPNSGFAWTRLFGDINVDAGTDQARTEVGSNAAYRADSDLSTDEQSVEADVDASEEGSLAAVGFLARKDSSGTQTFYFVRALFDSNEIDVFKDIAGVFTQIGPTIVGVVLTAGVPVSFRMQVQDDGADADIEVFINDVSQGVRTDTPAAISGNLRGGLFARKSVVGFMIHDNLVISDLPEPPPPPSANLPEYGQLRTAIGDPPVYGANILRS